MTATLEHAAQTTPALRQPMSRVRKERLIFGMVLAVSVALAVRLRNTAFIDEALYVNAGHAYLDHWLNGAPLGNSGAFFSGAPALYPVLAASLDSLGGLYLVRAFSLACVLLTAYLLRSTARYLWGPRAGLLTAASFLLVGPVVFISWLATFDALTVLLLATALWLGVVRWSYESAALQAAALTLATMAKYTAGVFVPVVLVLTLLLGRNALRRVALATTIGLSLLGLIWVAYGDSLAEDIAFTTTDRTALTPASSGFLLDQVVSHFLVLGLLAMLGVYAMFRRERWRTAAAGVVLLGAAAMLPAAQLRLGEAVSFEKHLAYSALFLSLAVGYGLARLSRRPLMVAPVAIVVMMLSLFGIVRGDAMYGWTNVAPVVTALEADPKSGLYISSAADVLDYHTRDLPGIAWETTFELYFEGDDRIRQAVEDERYERIILRSATVGSPTQDAAQAVFLEALNDSPAYALAFEPFPAGQPGDNWLIYTRL